MPGYDLLLFSLLKIDKSCLNQPYFFNIIIPKNNHFKTSKLTKLHRSTKTDITPTPQEFSFPHKNYINNTIRTNPSPSNFSDENSLTTPTSQKKQLDF